MPSIRRKDFIETRVDKSLDLKAAKADPRFLAALREAGLKPEDLDKLDLYAHDGVLRGPRELSALFELLKTLDPQHPRTELETQAPAKPTGWAPSKAGQAMAAFDTRFESAPARPVKPPLTPARLSALPLSQAVGTGAPNQKDDVLAVQRRLKELGFDVPTDARMGPKTEAALKVYRSMLTGTDEVVDVDALVKPGDVVHLALASADAPRWVAMPRQGPGFVNADTDHFDYGSSESVACLQEAAQAYQDSYRASHPNAAPISLNDVSRKSGGYTKDHETHQTGLDLDLRLPRTDGSSGATVKVKEYDREAAWAMLTALGQNPRVERLLLSDPVLLQRAAASQEPWAYKLFDGGVVHQNHIHVDVKPPRPSADAEE